MSIRFVLLGVLCCALLGGCPPSEVDEMMMTEEEEPALDPQSIFERQVKPELVGTCSCHAMVFSGIQPFLTSGDEYNAIINYSSGKFITDPPTGSLLLSKGKHQGPALSQEQYDKVKGWLENEAVARGLGTNSSPTTPTVALRAGSFYISLEALLQDPLARVTFDLVSTPSGSGYFVRNMQFTAGPTASVRIKRPRFIVFSPSATDLKDLLPTYDKTIGAGMSMTAEEVLLSGTPKVSALLALTFDVIAKVTPTTMVPDCKNPQDFTAITTVMDAICARQCHSASGADSRRVMATKAFDMGAAIAMDSAALTQLCIRTKARLNPTSLSNSMLLKQVLPASLGGIQNHFYKLADSTTAPSFQSFQMSVVKWGAKE